MKSLIIALSLATAPVSAPETPSVPAPQDDYSASEWCAQVAELAAALMLLRQVGGSLQQGLNVAGDPDDPAHGITRMIVLDAWEQPRYSTGAVQQTVIGTFRDDWHLACIRAAE